MRQHGPTVAVVPWARHDTAFTRAFEDLVVWEALVSNKTSAGRRHSLSWRVVDGMCVRVATEALGRVDLVDGLVAVSIDEAKHKKGQRYLTIACGQLGGRVVQRQPRAAAKRPSPGHVQGVEVLSVGGFVHRRRTRGCGIRPWFTGVRT